MRETQNLLQSSQGAAQTLLDTVNSAVNAI